MHHSLNYQRKQTRELRQRLNVKSTSRKVVQKIPIKLSTHLKAIWCTYSVALFSWIIRQCRIARAAILNSIVFCKYFSVLILAKFLLCFFSMHTVLNSDRFLWQTLEILNWQNKFILLAFWKKKVFSLPDTKCLGGTPIQLSFDFQRSFPKKGRSYNADRVYGVNWCY